MTTSPTAAIRTLPLGSGAADAPDAVDPALGTGDRAGPAEPEFPEPPRNTHPATTTTPAPSAQRASRRRRTDLRRERRC
ncbi:hypothetical protein [Streptomyces sp. NPDC046976]|uniref:hypothetical protein n=1 Tax=Streptomyces sp. NPDC046976 TaxID=3155258 RepID=UPI003405EB6A